MQHISGTHKDDVGQAIAGWFTEQTGHEVNIDFQAICWFEDEKPVACAMFIWYTGNTIEVHFHGPKKLTRKVLRDIMSFVFLDLKCLTLITRVKKDNLFKKYIHKIGFKYVGVIPNFYGPNNNDNAIFYVMQVDAAKKWLI